MLALKVAGSEGFLLVAYSPLGNPESGRYHSGLTVTVEEGIRATVTYVSHQNGDSYTFLPDVMLG